MRDEEAAAIKSRVTHAQASLATGINDDVSAWFHVKAYAEDGAALLAEIEQWRAIGRQLDARDRDATGEIVSESLYIRDCPLCHRRISGPVDHEPRYPPLPKLGHREDCPVLKARALLAGGEEETRP